MDHFILAAADLGVGTCWVAAIDPDAAKEVLELPGDVKPVTFRPPDNPRFTGIEFISPNCYMYRFQIKLLGELKAEVVEWLKEAYQVGKQEQLSK